MAACLARVPLSRSGTARSNRNVVAAATPQGDNSPTTGRRCVPCFFSFAIAAVFMCVQGPALHLQRHAARTKNPRIVWDRHQPAHAPWGMMCHRPEPLDCFPKPAPPRAHTQRRLAQVHHPPPHPGLPPVHRRHPAPVRAGRARLQRHQVPQPVPLHAQLCVHGGGGQRHQALHPAVELRQKNAPGGHGRPGRRVLPAEGRGLQPQHHHPRR